MPGIYGIMNVGLGALLAQQRGVEVTGHNIANVNTPGYTRQRVNLETNPPISFSPGQMGTGVKAREIARIYDRFLGVQINNENQNLGRWESQKGALERVEMILDESTGHGLNQAMSEFWNAWQDLTNNPAGSAERFTLVERSGQMTEMFSKSYKDMEQVRKDTDLSIAGTISEINLITEKIADLNRKISQTEVSGQNANDYRDERDLLLNELSLLIDINSFEDSDGKVTVLAGGGRPLVSDVSSWSLSTEINGSGFHNVVWLDNDGNAVEITDGISGGKLKGWLEVRDSIIPDYLARLDNLAVGIMNEVNAAHQTGYGLTIDLFTGLPFTGTDFFVGISASDMAVNQDIIDDTNKIAAAASPDGVPGDNSKAIAIADLQGSLTMSANTATFDDYYNSLVGDVGIRVQSSTTNYEHQSAMVIHMNEYRESVSGVSLDEEMVNLIKFQHAYDAAAKLISTVDELLITVINMV